jgi:LCP family protein required for cell wall assembly
MSDEQSRSEQKAQDDAFFRDLPKRGSAQAFDDPPKLEGEQTLLEDQLHFAEDAVRKRRRKKTNWWHRVTRRPRHFIKKHKALSIILGIALLLLIILLIWLWILNHKLNQIPRFDVDLGNNRPAATDGTNILLVGVDDGKGIDLDEMLEGDWQPGVFRSDAIMVMHLSEDGSEAQLVSIPRDSYVPVEGYGKTKINAAFSYGGPSLLGRTVEEVTGLHLDHIAVVDFGGFKGITEAVGGVLVYVPEDIVDPRFNHVFWKKGWQEVEGDRALEYVRARYGLPQGDFDRVQRHQNMMRAIANSVTDMSVLANPFAVTDLVDEIASHLAVDASLTSGVMRSLAFDALNLGSGDISYATAPYSGTATIEGAGSVVTLERKQVRALFTAIGHDDFAQYVADHQVEVLPDERSVN